MIGLVLAIVAATAASAVFTAAELAIFGLPDGRVRGLVEEGAGGSRALAELRERPERLLVMLRLGAITADALVVLLAGWIGLALLGLDGLVVGAAVGAINTLLLGVLMPMRYAVGHGARLALGLAPALMALRRVLTPILIVLERIVRALPERPGFQADTITESEIRQLTALGHTDIDEHERQIIERAFRLDETKAWDIMTPRVDIFAWPDGLTLAAIAPQLGTVPFSRVPIFGESIDDITGVLHVRDAYQALVSGHRDVALRALARQPLIVPGSVPLSTLLRDFQTRRIHLAVVVDEYGGTDGLVTLEDVIEELVGEIVDETDVAEEPITRVSRTEIVADGDADLREINHYFNTAFPLLEHRSLNGYLLEELGRVPEPGEALEREGILIEVLEASETQVIRARMRRMAHPSESAAAPEEAEPAGEPVELEREAGT